MVELTLKEKIKVNISFLCKRNKVKIRELEKLCGVGVGYFYKTNSKFAPRLEVLIKVAEVFNITVDDLIK